MRLTTILQYFSLQFVLILWLHLRLGTQEERIPIMLPTMNQTIMWLHALLTELEHSREGILRKWLIRKVQAELDHWEQLQGVGVIYAQNFPNE